MERVSLSTNLADLILDGFSPFPIMSSGGYSCLCLDVPFPAFLFSPVNENGSREWVKEMNVFVAEWAYAAVTVRPKDPLALCFSSLTSLSFYLSLSDCYSMRCLFSNRYGWSLSQREGLS